MPLWHSVEFFNFLAWTPSKIFFFRGLVQSWPYSIQFTLFLSTQLNSAVFCSIRLKNAVHQLIKVALKVTILSCQSSSIVIILNQRITLSYLRQTLHTKYASSSYLRSCKIIFYLKFLTFTIEIGQNSKIGNMKITINLLAELELHWKRYKKRK